MLEKSRPLLDKGVNLYSTEDIVDTREEIVEAFQKLAYINANRPKNIVIELNAYRKYVPILIRSYCIKSDIAKRACDEKKRIIAKTADNSNKRWTDAEDNQLIELACQENQTLMNMATIFGRTPASIGTRISILVGRKRLSQEVAGRFIGYIDGIKADSNIVGTVYKE